MQRDFLLGDYSVLGIERVRLAEIRPVAHVDVMTRSRLHASMLESRFQTRAFRFRRGETTLHAFPRLPAIRARAWLEEQGIDFVVRTDGLDPAGPPTWIQGGSA
ncbi:MAG: hypothetical protein ACREFX_06915 [Opitutaceae bacterium]